MTVTGDDRPTVVLDKWMPVLVGTKAHLIGVVIEGHTRLPSGHWIITSPIRDFDPDAGTARTSSTGRRYALRDRWVDAPPQEAHDVLANAIEIWRLPADISVMWDASLGREQSTRAAPRTSSSG
jgi:hypothetical protein